MYFPCSTLNFQKDIFKFNLKLLETALLVPKYILKKADHWQDLVILSQKDIRDAYPTSVTEPSG